MPPDDSAHSKSIRAMLQSRSHLIPNTHLKKPSESTENSFVKSGSHDDPGLKKSNFLDVKMILHEKLLNYLERKKLLASFEEGEIKKAVRDFVGKVADKEDFPMNQKERERLVQELSDETLGVGPLASLMHDPAVTDILVNSPDSVYVERYGKLEKTEIRFRDTEHLHRLIQRIVSSVGRRIDEGSPYVDARLPDGSRVNATMPPVTIDGPTISIRRFGHNRLKSEDLMSLGSLSRKMLDFLKICIKARKNIAISGGTGAGKSTVLGALAEYIPNDERIITIEDTVELVLSQEHVVRCETRPANIEGQGEILSRQLVRNALRMRPDRIIVGEVRGAEAFDMLQAMNTGHEGSMTTLHANSPRDALARLESMVLMTGIELPSQAIREQFVSAIDLLIHVERTKDGSRRITKIVELIGLEGGVPQTQEIYKYDYVSLGKKVTGSFVATGVVPRFAESIQARGHDIPMSLFKKS